MVIVTEKGITFDVSEVDNASSIIERKCQEAARGCVNPSSIMSNEDYLDKLCTHYRTVFPLCSVIVCGTEHTISGECYCIRYEQKISIFNNTRATFVYVIGRNLNTVFTLLGHGGYKNWIMQGWFRRDGNTVLFL